MDKIVLSLQHFASEMERERARLRTYDAMVRKAQAGHVTGGRVYGYDNVDVFSPEPSADGRPRRLFVTRRINDARAAIIRQIFALCADGYGLTRIAKTLNADRVAPPRRDGNGWAPTAVREILHRELYRGVHCLESKPKGHAARHAKPAAAAGRRVAPKARRGAAHRLRRRLGSGPQAPGRHQEYVSATTRPIACPSRFDLAVLLSGLGRCALCGGSVIAMSRHHGRRRGFFYGCAYNSKRGPTVCRNNLHMPQQVLEAAVIDSIAASFDEAEVTAAIDRALELLEERREAAREGRSSHEEALRIVRAEESRLIDAVKQGQELNALVAALHKAQERRRTSKLNWRRFPPQRSIASLIPDGSVPP